jgi:sugar lactone lactonase YvrE
MVSDRWIDDIVLVDQLPSNSWIRGMAIRPNGKGLMFRLDKPELWTADIDTPESEPELIHTFPDIGGIINFCPLLGAEEDYLVISGGVDMENVVFNDFAIQRVSLSPDDSRPPIVTKIAAFPDAGLLIAATALTERLILLADSGKHSIRWFNLETGKSGLLIEDDSMKVETEKDFFGLNQLRISGGYLWFTNNSAGLLCKIPMEVNENDSEVPVRLTGPIECIVDDIVNCDGLILSDNREHAYMINYVNGSLWRVDIDSKTGEGTTQIIMEDLVSSTTLQLHIADGKKKLYIVCCGEIQSGWYGSEGRPWGDIAAISSVTVSVTVVTTEEDA